MFNTPISEAAICGTAVGAAMVGLRPVVELMYMDFALMASDQISNQAAKWHYMTGAQTTVPLVIRASVGGGKGYGGQHSQTLESMFAHIPGLVVVYPATPYDAKGMLKSAIRGQPGDVLRVPAALRVKGAVPEDRLPRPPRRGRVKPRGQGPDDRGLGPGGHGRPEGGRHAGRRGRRARCHRPALAGAAGHGDGAGLGPQDRPLRGGQPVLIGSYVNEIVARVVAEAFDYLDAPVVRIGAANGIAPQSDVLEAAFLPNAADIANAVRGLI